MKKLLSIMAAAAAFAFAVYAASPAATQAWVIKYCADHGMTASTNANGTAYTYAGTEETISFQLVKPTAFTLVAADCDSFAIQSGVTNGMRFAYFSDSAYVNEPAKRYIRVTTNPVTDERTFIYNSWTGTVFGAKMWMTDVQTNRHFRIYSTRIFESEAHSITNGYSGGVQ